MDLCAFRFCGSCARNNEVEEQNIPRAFEPLVNEDNDSKALYALACFKGEQFKVGDGIYLPPDAFNFGWEKWFKICNVLKPVLLRKCMRLTASVPGSQCKASQSSETLSSERWCGWGVVSRILQEVFRLHQGVKLGCSRAFPHRAHQGDLLSQA